MGVMTSRWRGYPGLSRQALNTITNCPDDGETEGDLTQNKKREQCDHKGKNGSHKLKNASSHRELKEARNRFSPVPPEGAWPADTEISAQ